MNGRFGHVHFLNARTKEKSFSIKMNDRIDAFAFSPDGTQIYTHGGKFRTSYELIDYNS